VRCSPASKDPPTAPRCSVFDDGLREGSLGSAALDTSAVAAAEGAIKAGKSGTLTVEGVRVFAEVIVPSSILLVVGAGHVAMPMVTLARVLGFKTIVVDGRPRFATPERFPDVDDLKIGIPSDLIKSVPLVASTALVLVAHDYKYDLPVLRHALATPVGYVGLLGSSRRGKAILDLLREDGVGRMRSAGCTCPSASTWVRSRRRRSPWPCLPRSSPSSAGPPGCRSARRSGEGSSEGHRTETGQSNGGRPRGTGDLP
jgi:Xanthine and CO dehydrogenases maturation factor, XdhC/CoxF family